MEPDGLAICYNPCYIGPIVTVNRDNRIPPGLYLRGKIWWLAITADTGKRHYVSLSTKKLDEAIKKAAAIRARPSIRLPAEWAQESAIYLAERIKEGRLSPIYARSRRTTLKLFATENDIDQPARVTTKMLQAWHDGRASKNPETAKHYVLHVRAFLGWLVTKNRLQLNPAVGVRFHSHPARTRDVFVERTKIAHLIDNAPNDELRLIMLLGFECGMRRTEICEARVEWLNIPASTITIPAKDGVFQRKNRRSSTVPMTMRVAEFFRKREWPGPFLIRPNKGYGRHIYRIEFEDAFTAYMNEMGVICTCHDMRRSFCSNRIAAGMSVEEVAFIVGDTPQVVWKNYARFIPKTHRAELGAA